MQRGPVAGIGEGSGDASTAAAAAGSADLAVLSDRVARFAALTPLAAQRSHPVPQDVADKIWSRTLLPVVTRAGDAPGPFGNAAPIRDAGDMTIAYAVCPPGTGPSLHDHRRTFETFTVMAGRFLFTLGPNATMSVELGPFDVLSVPPGICRAFRNVSEADGVLQVIVTGGTHDMDDITFPVATAREIAARGPDHLAYFRSLGLHFDD